MRPYERIGRSLDCHLPPQSEAERLAVLTFWLLVLAVVVILLAAIGMGGIATIVFFTRYLLGLLT